MSKLTIEIPTWCWCSWISQYYAIRIDHWNYNYDHS